MRYIILFGSLNVGKQNRVNKAQLLALLQEVGLTQVKTYLQSGNAAGNSELTAGALRTRICEAFQAQFGFASLIVVQPVAVFHQVVQQLPFSETAIQAAQEKDPTVKHLYVYFLGKALSPVQVADLQAAPHEAVFYQADLQVVYVLTCESVRTSKTIATLQRLKQPMTARNWQTLEKIALDNPIAVSE